MQQPLNQTTAWEQGAVVVNARRDDDEIQARYHLDRTNALANRYKPLFAGSPMHTTDVFSIMSGEPLLMKKNQDIISGNGHFFRDTNYVCISSLNGAYVNDVNLKLGGKNLYDEFTNQWTFAGFARNDAMHDAHDSTRDNSIFACLIGGIKTTYNTGTDAIHAGDKIVWDIPRSGNDRRHIDGIDDDKILPILRTYKINPPNPDSLDLSGNATKKLTQLYRTLAKETERIVGTALSSANPGEPFDIKIGSYCL